MGDPNFEPVEVRACDMQGPSCDHILVDTFDSGDPLVEAPTSLVADLTYRVVIYTTSVDVRVVATPNNYPPDSPTSAADGHVLFEATDAAAGLTPLVHFQGFAYWVDRGSGIMHRVLIQSFTDMAAAALAADAAGEPVYGSVESDVVDVDLPPGGAGEGGVAAFTLVEEMMPESSALEESFSAHAHDQWSFFNADGSQVAYGAAPKRGFGSIKINSYYEDMALPDVAGSFGFPKASRFCTAGGRRGCADFQVDLELRLDNITDVESPPPTTTDGGAGIVFRYTSLRQYYVLVVYPVAQPRWRVYRVDQGLPSLVGQSAHTSALTQLPAYTFFPVSLSMVGGTISVTIAGDAAEVIEDPAPLPGGLIGITNVALRSIYRGIRIYAAPLVLAPTPGDATGTAAYRGLVVGGPLGVAREGVRARVAVVRRYTRALTAAEVATNYAAEAGRFEPYADDGRPVNASANLPASTATISRAAYMYGSLAHNHGGSVVGNFDSPGWTNRMVAMQLPLSFGKRQLEAVSLRLAPHVLTVEQPPACDTAGSTGAATVDPYSGSDFSVSINNVAGVDVSIWWVDLSQTEVLEFSRLNNNNGYTITSATNDATLRIKEYDSGDVMIEVRVDGSPIEVVACNLATSSPVTSQPDGSGRGWYVGVFSVVIDPNFVSSYYDDDPGTEGLQLEAFVPIVVDTEKRGSTQYVPLPSQLEVQGTQIVAVLATNSDETRIDFTASAQPVEYAVYGAGDSIPTRVGEWRSWSDAATAAAAGTVPAMALHLVSGDNSGTGSWSVAVSASATTGGFNGKFWTGGAQTKWCGGRLALGGPSIGFRQQEGPLSPHTVGDYYLEQTLTIDVAHDQVSLVGTIHFSGEWLAGDTARIKVDGEPVLDVAYTSNHPNGGCPGDWTVSRGFCYKYFSSAQTWQDSVNTCNGQNADLASLRDSVEEGFVGSFDSMEMWIGYNDRDTEGVFKWQASSGTTEYDYSRTLDGVNGVASNCVVLDPMAAEWRVRSCEDFHGFVCKRLERQACDDGLTGASEEFVVTLPHSAADLNVVLEGAGDSDSLGSFAVYNLEVVAHGVPTRADDAPAVDAATALPGYSVQEAATFSNSASVYGLQANTSYCVGVTVHNPSTGALSDLSTHTVKTELPSAPTPPRNVVASSATGGAISVAWDPPLDTGGLDVSHYTLRMDPVPAISSATAGTPGDASWPAVADGAAIDGSTPALQVGGLTAETMYTFGVSATNNVSTSSMSDAAVLSTGPLSAPSAPTGLRLVSATGGALTVAWDAPLDFGGIDLSSYIVQLVAPSGAVLATEVASNTALTLFVPQLNASTKYVWWL